MSHGKAEDINFITARAFVVNSIGWAVSFAGWYSSWMAEFCLLLTIRRNLSKTGGGTTRIPHLSIRQIVAASIAAGLIAAVSTLARFFLECDADLNFGKCNRNIYFLGEAVFIGFCLLVWLPLFVAVEAVLHRVRRAIRDEEVALDGYTKPLASRRTRLLEEQRRYIKEMVVPLRGYVAVRCPASNTLLY